MDRLNYTLNSNNLQQIKQKIREFKRKACYLINKYNIILRKRVVKDVSILVQACILYMIHELSFQRLSDEMALNYKVSMSDNAWKKQITKIAPIFYEVMMTYLNEKTKKTKEKDIFGYQSYAVDATDITLCGKGTVLRAHTEYDLSNAGSFNANIQDLSVGESVKLHNIKPNSLYFADRAYGKTSQMEYMIEKNSEFVFRFSPSQVRMFKDVNCTKKLDFKSVLNEEKTTSMMCYFKGKHEIQKVRIIISPIPKDKVDNAVIRAKKQSIKKQNKPTENTLIYAKWLFLATSLPKNIRAKEIVGAYSKRWQIELHFKRSKSLLRFHKLRNCSPKYAFAITQIWLSVTAFVYILFNEIPLCKSLEISTFNAFSLFSIMLS